MRIAAFVLFLAGTLSGQTFWAEVLPFGAGTPGSQGVPQLRVDGLPAKGQPSPALRITRGRPHAVAQLVVGTAVAPTFLPQYAALLYPAPLLRLLTTLDETGTSSSFLPQPSTTPASLIGSGFMLQGLAVDSAATGGVAFTGAIEVHFGVGSAVAQLFADPRTFVEAGGVALALGDLDEDGRLDAVTIGEDGTLTVAIATPLGDLFPVATLGSGGEDGRDIEVADVDEDGHLDLVVACNSSASGLGRLGVRRGDGQGGFGSPVILGTGDGCHAVEVADVDDDGHLDLVATRHKGLVVFRGLGDGTFGTIAELFLPTIDFVTDLALAEVTGDGVLDALVAPLGDHVLLVAEGAGDGTFEPSVGWAISPWRVQALDVGDVDGDERADAVVAAPPAASQPSGVLLVLPGQPAGGFGSMVVTTVPSESFVSLELGHMDGDATFDAVIARQATASLLPTTDVAVLAGLGDATFGPPGPARLLATSDLDLADVDGDGAVDAAATAPEGHVLQVLRGDGQGAVVPAAGTTGLSGVQAVLAATDLDADGDVDLVTLGAGSPVLRVMENDGAGGFLDARSIALGAFSWDFEVADLTGDALPDIVAIGSDPDDGIAVMLNEGGLVFAAPLVTPAPPGLADLSQLDTGLLDGDDHVDVLLHGLANIFTSTLFVLQGAGDGSFALVETQTGVSDSYFYTDLADVDADGELDAVGTPFGEKEFAWHAGGGDGTLADGIVVALPERAGYVTAAELDGQPGDELVFTPLPYFGDDFEQLQVVRAVGAGVFEAEVYVAPDRLAPVDAGDLNGDGAADLLGASYTTGSLAIWLGLGGGALAPAQPILSGAGGYARLGDTNGDGLLDVVTCAGDTSLVVLENEGAAIVSP